MKEKIALWLTAIGALLSSLAQWITNVPFMSAS